MSRLSGSIRLVSEKPPIVAPSEKAVDNLFAFNKGTKITANNGYEVILRPEVHGFDIKIKNPNVIDKNNYAVRAAGLKLPKTGDYFVTFDVYAQATIRARIAADINDKQANENSIWIESTSHKYFGVYTKIDPDAYKSHGINGGFIDFNIVDKILIPEIVIHIENVMIGAGSKEAPFSRPIEDIVANALNGIDSPPVVPRRFLAATGVFYKNGKEVDANDGVAYLDFIVPSDADYKKANMYMCLESMSFNDNPTEKVIKQTGKWKLVHRKAIEQIDTLISNTIDTNNLSAQRVIFKSGNTVKGVVTGTPGSSVTSNASGDKVEGTAKYYMWLGSDVPESAPFSIDVDGNVKIGGKASFQRTSVDVTSNITIDTSTKDSLFNVISTDNNYITIKINGGNYSNKEFEFISLANVSNISHGGFRLEAGDNIEFIYGADTSNLIYVNSIGGSIKLRHIQTNIHGTIKNYLVVVNAGDFTYDIKDTQGMIVSKPIEYAGTRYDISITIKTHDFYYNDGRKFSLNGDDLYDNIFIKSNLDDDIKRIAGSINNVLVGNFPVTITIEKYNNNVVSDKRTETINVRNGSGSTTWGQVYWLGTNSGTGIANTIMNIDLNILSQEFMGRIINPMSEGNSIHLVWDKYANNNVVDAWGKIILVGDEGKQNTYNNHSLILNLGASMPIEDIAKNTRDGDAVVFNGRLYIRH